MSRICKIARQYHLIEAEEFRATLLWPPSFLHAILAVVTGSIANGSRGVTGVRSGVAAISDVTVYTLMVDLGSKLDMHVRGKRVPGAYLAQPFHGGRITEGFVVNIAR